MSSSQTKVQPLDSTAQLEVTSLDGSKISFLDLSRERRILLVFIRHFGCVRLFHRYMFSSDRILINTSPNVCRSAPKHKFVRSVALSLPIHPQLMYFIHFR
jgi:hypothetical protein